MARTGEVCRGWGEAHPDPSQIDTQTLVDETRSPYEYIAKETIQKIAQKRVFNAKKNGVEPDAGDKNHRNQARKARRRAKKALQEREADVGGSWVCTLCTYENLNPNGLACEMCSMERTPQS